MANSLSVLVPKILARGLMALRENAVTIGLVNQGYSLQAQQKGNAITIPKSVSQTAAAVTPAVTPPANSDKTPTSTTLTLDKWYETHFHLNDQELTQIDADANYVPLQTSEAIRALVNQADSDLLGLYTNVYGAAGTAGTTPFASDASPWTGAAGGRQLLNEQLAPMGMKRIILDPAAEANAMDRQNFQAANWRGDGGQAFVNGEIGTALGANWYMNQNVPTHTGGTLTNGSGKLAKVNDASYTVGETTVDIDDTSLSGTVVVGDIFTVAGDSQQYVVTANATAATNAIAGMAFLPASKVAWADNAVITFVADHTVNLAFHPDAFAFASAPLAEVVDPSQFGVVQSVMRDPISGLVVRLRVTMEHYQLTWRFDTLYGVACPRPEYAARLLG